MIAVTSRVLCREPFEDRIRALAEAGPELVILREKDLPDGDYRDLADRCMRICASRNVPFAVHSRIAVARELGIPRIHMTMDGLRSSDVSGFRLVGASVHSADEAVEAERLGAHYVLAGNVFETSCKPGACARGPEFLRDVCDATSLPVYAIGGVDPGNYFDVLEIGAAGAASMSLSMTADPEELVSSMRPPVGSWGLLSRRFLLLFNSLGYSNIRMPHDYISGSS